MAEYCTSCGKQVSEDMIFCKHCGTKLKYHCPSEEQDNNEWDRQFDPISSRSNLYLNIQSDAHEAMNTTMSRQERIASVGEAKRIINEVFSRLQEAEQLRNEADFHLLKSKDVRMPTIHKVLKGLSIYWVLWYIMFLIAIFFTKGSDFPIPIPKPLIVIDFIFVLFVINLIRKKRKRKENEIYEAGEAEKREYAKMTNSYEAEIASINQYVKVNAYKLSMFPKQYLYPIAVNYVYQLFYDNRVETMKDALDKFDQERHNWEMEEKGNTMILLMNQQVEMLQSINDGLSYLTEATWSAAGVAAANLFI